MTKHISIIGAGISGLSAACYLAKFGYQVTVHEQHSIVGGRARKFEAEGFTFDMGPSWYWMPDVFERFFNDFGHKVEDYFKLERLDPSYQVFFTQSELALADNEDTRLDQLNAIEPNSKAHLQTFLANAKMKYDLGMSDLIRKPGLSLMEYSDQSIIKQFGKLHLLKSFKSYINKYFKSDEIRQILAFPILFLGALPKNTPALYSLMNYADFALGTWYPQGGMHQLPSAMKQLAEELGVQFEMESQVKHLEILKKQLTGIRTNKGYFKTDAVVGSADYHFIETQLLSEKNQSYTKSYWESRKMAPSSIIYYLGVGKKIEGLLHHNLFFDAPFDTHVDGLYKNPSFVERPMFYVCCPSKTDSSVAPDGMENLFVLIPTPPGLEDNEAIRAQYLDQVIARIEERTGVSFQNDLVYSRSYGNQNFVNDYNAFKGNAYGLANTLMQTGPLKPSIKSKKLNNLYYTGQLTTPGPGLPPSIISGEIVSNLIKKEIS